MQTSQPTLETFEKLLGDNRLTFFSLRTAKSLQTHWLLMKQYHLLPDQTGNTGNANSALSELTCYFFYEFHTLLYFFY